MDFLAQTHNGHLWPKWGVSLRGIPCLVAWRTILTHQYAASCMFSADFVLVEERTVSRSKPTTRYPLKGSSSQLIFCCTSCYKNVYTPAVLLSIHALWLGIARKLVTETGKGLMCLQMAILSDMSPWSIVTFSWSLGKIIQISYPKPVQSHKMESFMSLKWTQIPCCVFYLKGGVQESNEFMVWGKLGKKHGSICLILYWGISSLPIMNSVTKNQLPVHRQDEGEGTGPTFRCSTLVCLHYELEWLFLNLLNATILFHIILKVIISCLGKYLFPDQSSLTPVMFWRQVEVKNRGVGRL